MGFTITLDLRQSAESAISDGKEIFMNKIGFAFSGMFVITGVVTLLKTAITNLVMPIRGIACKTA